MIKNTNTLLCIGLLREQDSNLRPVDYESTELPTAPPRDVTYIRVCEPTFNFKTLRTNPGLRLTVKI